MPYTVLSPQPCRSEHPFVGRAYNNMTYDSVFIIQGAAEKAESNNDNENGRAYVGTRKTTSQFATLDDHAAVAVCSENQ